MRDFLRRLLVESPAPLDTTDEKLALGALMVRIARTDGTYAASEVEVITRLLSDRFALPPDEALALRVEAEEIETEAPDTVRFTRAIKDSVAYEHRAQLVESLWRVVLADGHRHEEENGLMRLVVSLLGINDRDSALARQRVEARLQ